MGLTREQQVERQAVLQRKARAFFLHVQRTYGITEEQYWALYAAQGERCYICRKARGKDRTGRGSKYLGVDHNHLTGEVRGLLCTGSLSASTCNRLIAHYSVEALQRAVQYMQSPPAREVLHRATDA